MQPVLFIESSGIVKHKKILLFEQHKFMQHLNQLKYIGGLCPGLGVKLIKMSINQKHSYSGKKKIDKVMYSKNFKNR